MVAGVGFEPHDLRVMSPTSYQTALPRDVLRLTGKIYYNIINRNVNPLKIIHDIAI